MALDRPGKQSKALDRKGLPKQIVVEVGLDAYMSCKQPHAIDWPILVHPGFHHPAQSPPLKGELLPMCSERW